MLNKHIFLIFHVQHQPFYLDIITPNVIFQVLNVIFTLNLHFFHKPYKTTLNINDILTEKRI